MASRYLIIITISGAVILLIGIIAGFLRIGAELRHGNLASSRDWVNPPYTSFDTFILGFHVSPFVITGSALLLAALLWTLFRQFSN
jgi:hypothetical protein